MPQIPIFDETYIAQGNLSAKQYFIVKAGTGDRTAALAGDDERGFGVIVEPGAEGKAIAVRHLGVVEIAAGASISAGAPVGPDANGRAETKSGAGTWALGIARTGVTLPATPLGTERVEVLLTGPFTI